MEPKTAYLEEVEDEEFDIDALAVDDVRPNQDDRAILAMLEEDDIDIDDEDLDDDEDVSETPAALQHPSSVGAKAARFVAAQRRKLIWFKRCVVDSDDQLRDDTIEEAKLRMLEAGELQPEISDELRDAAPTAFQTRFASYIENIVNDPQRINEIDKPIFTNEAVPPLTWAKAASQWIPAAVQAKFLAREEPDLSDIGWDDTEDWAVYWCGLLKALPTQHCHSYIGSATTLSSSKNETGNGIFQGGARRRRSAHDNPNCNIAEPNMFHSLKVQKFNVGGRQIQRPAVWSLLLRIPIQVLRKSTSSQLTTLRIICLLTEAVFHDWLGSYQQHRLGSLNASSPWDHPDRIWLGTNSFPPLANGIPATWSAELTRQRKLLKGRQKAREHRNQLLEKDAAGTRERFREKDRRRREALRGPNPGPGAQKPANPDSLRRVIRYFEDDPVKFMALLLKWRGVSVEDQVTIIKADNRPLLDREIAHSVTMVELENFNHFIYARLAYALKASKKTGPATNRAADKEYAPKVSNPTDDEPKKAWLVCPVSGCPRTDAFQNRSNVTRHIAQVHGMSLKEANKLVPAPERGATMTGPYKCHFDGCEKAKSGFPSAITLKTHLMGGRTGHKLSEAEADEALEAYRSAPPRRKAGPHKCFLKDCPAAKIGFLQVCVLRKHLQVKHKFSKEQAEQLAPKPEFGRSLTKLALERALNRPEMEALAEKFERDLGMTKARSGTYEAADEEDMGVEATDGFQGYAESGLPEAIEPEDMDIDEAVSVQDGTESGRPFVRLNLKSRGRPRLLCLEEERKGAPLSPKSGSGAGQPFMRFNPKSRGRPGLICLDQLRSSKVVKAKSGPGPEERRGLKQLSLSDWLA